AVWPARDAVATLDLRLIDDQEVADSALRVEHGHIRIAHQRKEIAVAGDDLDLPRDLRQQRGDDVLGLEAFRTDHLDADRAQNSVDDRLLWLELGGHRTPLQAGRLVTRGHLPPKRRPPIFIRGDHERLWLAVSDEPREHVEESPHRIHRLAIRCLESADRNAEEGAEHQTRPVEEEPVSCHGSGAGWRRSFAAWASPRA